MLAVGIEFAVAIGAGADGFGGGRGNGIATDTAGNVYAAGVLLGTADFDPGPGVLNLSSVGNEDIFVAKYTSSGALVWARSMGGTSSDVVRAITVDGSGNVYTTGSFNFVADFDPGPGTFNLTGVLGDEIFVSKLDAGGNFVWAGAFRGATGGDQGIDIAVDGGGNVITTGVFHGQLDFDPGPGTFLLTGGGSGGIFVSKLDANGDFVWARSFNGSIQKEGRGLALDDSGNIYTTGFFSATTDFDPGPGTFNLGDGVGGMFVSKLDANGNFVWARAMGSSMANGIALDDAGNVYTAGLFASIADFDPGPGTANLTSNGATDVFVSKLDASGNFVWARAMGGSATFGIGDQANGIAVDDAGNVYTAGFFTFSADFDPGTGTFNLSSTHSNGDLFVSKLDAAGNFVWAVAAGGGYSSTANAIAVDSSENFYITGAFNGTVDFDPGPGTFNRTGTGHNIFVAKLTQGPDVPAPSTPDLDATSDSGPSNSDGITNDATPTFSGTSPPGEQIEIFDGVISLGSTTADAGGHWSFTAGLLAEGVHSVSAMARDHGISSPQSGSLVIAIDTIAPDAPTRPEPSFLTLDTVMLSGNAEPGSTVELLDGAVSLGTTTPNANFFWTLTSPPLAVGVHEILATASDAAGNTSPPSPVLSVTIGDVPPPSTPTSPDLDAASDSGASDSDNITADNTPTFHGAAEPGSTVELLHNASSLGTTTANGSGIWSLTTGLADGEYSIAATATTAGGTSPASTSLLVTIDTIAPASPAAPDLEAASDTGVSLIDNLTADNTPTLNGSAEAGSTVELLDGATSLGTTNADGNGYWSFTTGPLLDGVHILTASAIDVAGNSSSTSTALAVTIDTVAPAAPVITSPASGIATSDTTPSFSGMAEPGASVGVWKGSIGLGGGGADAAGNWTATSSTLADGSHAVVARATDAAGNESPDSAVVTFTVSTSTGYQITGEGVLQIFGPPEGGQVLISASGSLLVVQAPFLSPPNNSLPLAAIQSIRIVLGSGPDLVIVNRVVTLPLVIDGGAGNDVLVAGGGPATLLGGPGNDILLANWASAVLVGGDGSDTLLGGIGRNILIGGAGSDILLGVGNQDILIGGSTTYDTDINSLVAIRDFWSGPGSFTARRQALSNGITGPDGPLQLVAGETVLDDGAVDLLFGGGDDDWLLQFLGDVGF